MSRFLFLVFPVLLLAVPCQGKPRLAIVPLMYDMELENSFYLRRAAGDFDARLQAELLVGWDIELVSRTHLSAVVFEQRLRAATDATAMSAAEVLPADVIVAPILDFNEKKLRLYVVPVKTGMEVPKPRQIAFRDAKDFHERIIVEATRSIAFEAHLSARANVASSAQAAVPPSEPLPKEKHPLTCALLTPVCTDELRRAADSQAPLIQAALEQSLVTLEAGRIRLIDRSHLSEVLGEKMRNSLSSEWNPNLVSSIGRMAKADLLLIPYVHETTINKVRTDLFAVDINGGLITACSSWEGASDAPPPADKVVSVLREGMINRVKEKKLLAKKQQELRHAEAAFLTEISAGGARPRISTRQNTLLRLADAIIGLTADDGKLMGSLLDKFWSGVIPKSNYNLQAKYFPRTFYLDEKTDIKKSGFLARFQAEAREVLQRPFEELAKSGSDIDKFRLANFYLCEDEPAKALAALMANVGSLAELFKNDMFIGLAASALLDLKRYRECADLVLSRETLNPLAWECGLVACRELGDKEREFKALWDWKNFRPDEDFIIRRLELGTELGKAKEIVNRVTNTWHYGELNKSAVKLALVRARFAAGQKELAISDAQGALICERIDKDNRNIAELEAMLAREGVKPLEKFPPVRDFLKIPASWCIQLVHDQSITPEHANAVAEQMADIWGCTVKIWNLKLDVKKLSFHNRFRNETDAHGILNLLTRADLPPEPRLGLVFLTHLNCTYLIKGDERISASKFWHGCFNFVSDVYVQLYNPKELHLRATASLCAGFEPVVRYIRDNVWEHEGNYHYQLVDPDMFAGSSHFDYRHRSTGVSPTTGKQLAKVKLDKFRTYLDEIYEDSRREVRDQKNDPEAVQDISRQFATLKPVVVTYPVAPAGSVAPNPNPSNPTTKKQ